MIELMLQAERALTAGMVDQAERLYRQAIEHDPRNSIAIVGLARVALERDDDRGAYQLARQALAVDPENAAAQRLATRMAEVLQYRGEAVSDPAPATAADSAPVPESGSVPPPTPTAIPPATPSTVARPARRAAPKRPNLVRRLLGRR
jgi:thioredoxin-like negative regulator of GroEL